MSTTSSKQLNGITIRKHYTSGDAETGGVYVMRIDKISMDVATLVRDWELTAANHNGVCITVGVRHDSFNPTRFNTVASVFLNLMICGDCVCMFEDIDDETYEKTLEKVKADIIEKCKAEAGEDEKLEDMFSF